MTTLTGPWADAFKNNVAPPDGAYDSATVPGQVPVSSPDPASPQRLSPGQSEGGLSVRAQHIKRFLSKTTRNGACLEFLSRLSGGNQGQFFFNGRTLAAPKAAYALFTGLKVPNDRYVIQQCRNKHCVNPAHLALSNQRPTYTSTRRYTKPTNRPMKGERNPMSKLTEADVLEIRRLHPTYSQRQLSLRFGVTKTNVRMILKRLSWKHC